MTFEIVAANHHRWDEVFYSLQEKLQDPFSNSGYFKLQKNTENQYLCIIQEGKENTFFYPFLKTEINKYRYKLDTKYYDIQGIYGYNGAIIQSDSKSFITNSRKLFEKYCLKENIIAEFVRFNTISKNHLFFSDMSLIQTKKNIIINLDKNDIWQNEYEHSTRKNIKKAIRNELSHAIIQAKHLTTNDIDTFFTIYTQTMQRNNADDEYYHSKEYFQSFQQYLPTNSLFVFIYKENKVISVEIVLHNNYIAYSFLGGTLCEFFQLRPNDYLKHIVIEKLQKIHLKYYCLGGGVTAEDGIYRYKKSFSRNGIYDFFIGKRIYNQKIYDSLVIQWEEKSNPQIREKYSQYLLKYHY